MYSGVFSRGQYVIETCGWERNEIKQPLLLKIVAHVQPLNGMAIYIYYIYGLETSAM